MFRGVGRLRLAVVGIVLALTAGGCSGSDGKQAPEWVRSPPKYMSCGGVATPRLLVDTIRAAGIGKPESENISSKIKINENNLSFECSILHESLELWIYQEEVDSLAGAFSPPDPLLVPLHPLPGFVSFNWASLWVPCTRGSETTMLTSSVNIGKAQRVNPEVRLAMARLLVDMVNSARERFGCSEGPLPVPEKLPDIPVPKVVRTPQRSGDDEKLCDVDLLEQLPGYFSDDVEQALVFRTPEPGGVLSTCEIRVGNSGAYRDYEVPGRQRVAVVAYRGVLARAYQNSQKHAMPRYDLICHGKPVSYRVYVQDPEEGGYVQADSGLQRELASAAARRDGCPLPEK